MNRFAHPEIPVTNKRCDISGSEISRVGRHYLRCKLLPFGNYAGGPGLRYLLLLGALHYLARPCCRLMLRFEGPARYLRSKVRGLVA